MGINHSLWGYFFQASPIVKGVMLVLLLASLFSWTLIFQRKASLKLLKKQLVAFQDSFADSLDPTYLWAKLNNRQAKDNKTPLAEIFRAGYKEFLRYKKAGATEAQTLAGVARALEIAETKMASSLDDYLSLLATIGSTSPFIGLLGTVWGIMTSFQALGAVQQATMAMVAPGISEALVATAMGLFAAIPAVIAYNRFTSQTQALANEYAIFREECLAQIARYMACQSSPSLKPKQVPHYEIEDEAEYA